MACHRCYVHHMSLSCASYDAQRMRLSCASYDAQHMRLSCASYDVQRMHLSCASYDAQRMRLSCASYDAQRMSLSCVSYDAQRMSLSCVSYDAQRMSRVMLVGLALACLPATLLLLFDDNRVLGQEAEGLLQVCLASSAGIRSERSGTLLQGRGRKFRRSRIAGASQGLRSPMSSWTNV